MVGQPGLALRGIPGCEVAVPSNTSLLHHASRHCTVSFYTPKGCVTLYRYPANGVFTCHSHATSLMMHRQLPPLISCCCFHYNYIFFTVSHILVLNNAGQSYCVLSEPAVWLFSTILNRLKRSRSVKSLLINKECTQHTHHQN